MSQELLCWVHQSPRDLPQICCSHTSDAKLRLCQLPLGHINSLTSFNKINTKARNCNCYFQYWAVSVKKTTSGAVTPRGSMISNQECWDGGTAEVPQGGNWEIVLLSLKAKPCASALLNGWTGNPNSDWFQPLCTFPSQAASEESSEKYSKKNKTEPQNECNVRNSIYYKSFLDRNNQ